MLKIRLTGKKDEVYQALSQLPLCFEILDTGQMSQLKDSQYYRLFVDVELLKNA